MTGFVPVLVHFTRYHRPQKRAIQYSVQIEFDNESRSVLDAPPSRGMTVAYVGPSPGSANPNTFARSATCSGDR